MRLFIIEDDKKLSAAVSRQLEKQGYQTDLCDSGDTALFYLAQTIYDIIILDRMLPVLDGLTILEFIRKKGISTPVIVVTALNGISDRTESALHFSNLTLESSSKLLSTPPPLFFWKLQPFQKKTELLEFFIRNKGQTLERDQIL